MIEDKNIGLNKLFMEYVDEVSSTEQSESFLKENGLDPDTLVNEGLRKIKQIQMNIAAESTERQYLSLKSAVLQRAKDEVEKLISNTAFSLESFIKIHNIKVAYKNFDELTQDEIKEFLERHFMLKFGNESNNKNGI